MPMTLAITITQMRYSATSQVQAFRCASAHRAGPEFIVHSPPPGISDGFTYPEFQVVARPASMGHRACAAMDVTSRPARIGQSGKGRHAPRRSWRYRIYG